MITLTPIRAFKDNYIWMLCEPASRFSWVVDPGDAQPVIDVLNKNDLKLAGILLTHHHADHSGGIKNLVEFSGNIPVYGSHKSSIQQITHPVKSGDMVTCLSTQFQVIEIPGHTLDHIAFFGNSILFSGDTLFSAGCGRVFEGTPPQMYASLQQLFHLPDETLIYCGHEYTLSNLMFANHVEPENEFITKKIESLNDNPCTLPSLLSDERMMNPFFRCDKPSVISAVENHFNKKLTTPIDVFSHLREWKNKY